MSYAKLLAVTAVLALVCGVAQAQPAQRCNGVAVPSWNTASRPSGAVNDGTTGYNSTIGACESYSASSGGWLAAGPSGALARSIANQDPFIASTDPTATGGVVPFGDFQEFDAVACYNAGNPGFCSAQAAKVIDFTSGSGTVSTPLTVPIAGQTLTLGSSAFCTAVKAGQPLFIAGITAPGTHLVGCLASNRIAIDLPVLAAATGGTVTIQYGVNFTAACPSNPAASGVTGCIGSTIITGAWLGSAGGGSGAVMTITAVNTPTNITVSSNSAAISNNASAHFVTGHDDSAAVSAACSYAQAHRLALVVPVNHLTTALDRRCYGVLLRGAGRLATAGDILSVSATVFPEPVVVPWAAAAPSPPRKAIIAKRDLPNVAAAGVTPSFAFAYDSLASAEPNGLNDLGAYPALFLSEFAQQNAGISPIENLCGVGGAKMVDLDGNPTAFFAPCTTTTATPFLTQIASNASPHLLDLAGTNNDGTALSVGALIDVWLKATLPAASGGVFTNPIDVSVTAHHPYSRIAANGAGITPVETSMDYAAGYAASFADIMHLPLFDGAAEGQKHLWGYDPRGLKFERNYDTPYGASALGMPFLYQRRVNGIAATFTKAGQTGNTFWANYTANGGVTDSRGPFLAMQTGYDQGQKNYLWLFQLAGNVIGIQCDPINTLPGLGCTNPATGLPPVKPSLLGSITVSAANPAVITTTTGFGWPCTVGMTVAVPSAGASQTPPGFATYIEPWITTVTVCTSNTSITGTGAAPTPGTFTNSFVMSGNPIINTGIVDVGDGFGNEKFHVEFKDDDLAIWWNVQSVPAYVGKIMRPRSSFAFKIFSGGSHPTTLFVATDLQTAAMSTFQTARVVPNITDFVDTDVNGPAVNVISNQVSIGPSGGDGNNHSTSMFGEKVLRPMYRASDFFIPTASGITTVVPTTGQTIVVPNRTGTYTVNPAGTLAALTITLPNAGFSIGDLLTIPFRQAITAGTINGATGQTVNGAAIAAAAIAINTTLAYRYVATNTWQRVQ